MTIGKVSGGAGSIRPVDPRTGDAPQAAGRATTGARNQTDRLEISPESLALRRAQEAARALLVPETDEARAARVETASQRLADGAYEDAAVRGEIADRLGGFLGLA